MGGLGAPGWGLAIAALLVFYGPAEAGRHVLAGPPDVGRHVLAGPPDVGRHVLAAHDTRDVMPYVASGFSRTFAADASSLTAADEAVKRQLAGEWTLVKYEIFGENGQTRPGNYDVGRINYGEREMSAHLMRSGRPTEAPTTESERAAAYQAYLGYFGPYTIDADKKIVVHQVAGSSLPNWIGTDQIRYYGFSSDGRQLTLSLKAVDRITQTLTWERVR